MSPITDAKPEAEVKPVTPTPLSIPRTTSPAITSANLPKPPVAAVVEVEFDDQGPIIAAPLITPDFTNLKKKNPNIELRWVNRVAGVELSGEGARYAHMKAMGFVNATELDVEVPKHLLHNGAIIQGDLILMKIDRRVYKGALLDNELKAKARTSPRAYLNDGTKKIKDALNEVPGSAENKRKIQPFIPGSVESLANDR